MVHSPQAAHTHREAEKPVVGWQPVEVAPYHEAEQGVGAMVEAENGFRLVAPAFPGSPFYIGQRIEGRRVVWEDRCYSKPACPQS